MYPDNPNCFAASTLVVLGPDGSSVLKTAAVPGGVAAILLDANGGVYVAGSASTPFLATPGAYAGQPLSTLPSSGFAAKLDFTKPGGLSISCLVNAASGRPGRNSYANTGAVSPGEVVTIFGQGFQPGPGLRVTFDGLPAPVLYADPGQINAVVPMKTGVNSAVTRVAVEQSGVEIGPYPLPVSPAVPGIFGVIDQTGNVNATNVNNGPAAPGSIISVFLTGAGV